PSRTALMAKIFFVLSFDRASAEGLPSAPRTDRETTPRPALQAQYQEPPQSSDQMWSVLEYQYQRYHRGPHGGAYEILATLPDKKVRGRNPKVPMRSRRRVFAALGRPPPF